MNLILQSLPEDTVNFANVLTCCNRITQLSLASFERQFQDYSLPCNIKIACLLIVNSASMSLSEQDLNHSVHPAAILSLITPII